MLPQLIIMLLKNAGCSLCTTPDTYTHTHNHPHTTHTHHTHTHTHIHTWANLAISHTQTQTHMHTHTHTHSHVCLDGTAKTQTASYCLMFSFGLQFHSALLNQVMQKVSRVFFIVNECY